MRDERSFLTLAAEIRQEFSGLSQLADEIPTTWAKGSTLPEAERCPYLESTAPKLHDLYTACERIFEKIAGEVNGAFASILSRQFPPDQSTIKQQQKALTVW